MKTTFRRSLGILIALALLYFLIKPFRDVPNQVDPGSISFNLFWLSPSFLVLLLYWMGLVVPWGILLREFTGQAISFRTIFLLFHLANVTRYLPGRVWGVVRLLMLSERFGLRKSTLAGSLPLHVGFQTLVGGFSAIPLLFSPHFHQSYFLSWELVPRRTLLIGICVSLIVVVGLFLHPRVRVALTAAAMQTCRIVKQGRDALRACWFKMLVGHSLLWLCQGFAFFFFVNSLVPVPFSQAHLMLGCYAFAWLIGFLSVLTPGGLGVREGLLVLLLSPYMPAFQATRVALLCRVWMLSAEIVLAGVALFLNKKK